MALGIGLWVLGMTTLGLILRSYWREYRRDAWLILATLFSRLGQRCAERALRHDEPHGELFVEKVRSELESRGPVEMQRTKDGCVVWAGGRFLKVKV